MSEPLEGVAFRWLAEPAFLKVFKNTFDVIQDYVSYGLSAIGAIALSVKFMTSLGTGDVVCIMAGVQNGTHENKFGPYPSSAFPMVGYANFDRHCIDAALTPFMQWLPFLFIIQALLLVIAEKFFLKMPRISGKIEIFYKSIVEDSLFGKDPDIAEDVRDDKSNIDAISRRRKRKEIGTNLKQSSYIKKMYIFKNILELYLVIIFIPLNCKFGMDAIGNMEPSPCEVDVRAFPELGLDEGSIHFQCTGKKVRFFLILVIIQQALLLLFAICSFSCLMWCAMGRKISRLLWKMENEKQHADAPGIYYKALKKTWDMADVEVGTMQTFSGTDFYFLFDLLAHNSGIETTLRVLTHADETFHKIFMPNIESDSLQKYVKNIKVEEDKLKVCWKASDFECWILQNKYGNIKVDAYVVTIFPAEMISNRKAVNATLLKDDDPNDDKNMYSTEFVDLQGGTIEYVVTIAGVIGQSRMKGCKIVTTLVPYGAETPNSGLVKRISTDQAEIGWEPPKGGFGKYVLTINKEAYNRKTYAIESSDILNEIFPISGPLNYMDNEKYTGYSIDDVRPVQDLYQLNAEQIMRELGNKVTNYNIFGLSPGEPYEINLKTKTGIISTRNPLSENFLTKPMQVCSLNAESITTTEADITWVKPDGHSSIKAFNISFEHLPERELVVKYEPSKVVSSYKVTNLTPGTAYTVLVKIVCIHAIKNRNMKILKTISEPKKCTFTTQPDPPLNLELENRQSNSLTVKWKPATNASQSSQKFRLTIEAPDINYHYSNEIAGNRTIYSFSKLPEIVGTGEDYKVKVVSVVIPPGSNGKEVVSEPLIKIFKTKPLPPTNFRIGPEDNKITWTKSATPKVVLYKIKYKQMKKDEAKDNRMESQSHTQSCTISSKSPDGLKQHRGFTSVVKKFMDVSINDVDEENKHEEVIISEPDKPFMSYIIENMDPMVQYRVSISAIVLDVNGEYIESMHLHEKIIQTIDQNNQKSLAIYLEDFDE